MIQIHYVVVKFMSQKYDKEVVFNLQVILILFWEYNYLCQFTLENRWKFMQQFSISNQTISIFVIFICS